MRRFEKNVEGVIKKFKANEGYGFAVDHSGQDYFVHISDTEGEQALERGDRIWFDSYQTERGFRARRIRIQERGVTDIPETLRRAEPKNKAHLAGPAPRKPQEKPQESNKEPIVTRQDGVDHSRSQAEKGSEYRNGKLECSGCDQWVKPRIITGPPKHADMYPGRWTPVPLYSMCPTCGTTLTTFDAHSNESTLGVAWFVFLGIIGLLFFAFVGSRL